MNRAIVSTISQARTQGKSGAPLDPACSIWLLLDIVLDHSRLPPSAVSVAGRKGLAHRSRDCVERDSFGQRAARAEVTNRLLAGDTADILPLMKSLPLGAWLYGRELLWLLAVEQGDGWDHHENARRCLQQGVPELWVPGDQVLCPVAWVRAALCTPISPSPNVGREAAWVHSTGRPDRAQEGVGAARPFP